jgi:coenzyme Q-binding protein COQ10
MFALVADVERYPEFLPWCTALRVQNREQRNGQEVLMADMTVTFRVLHERFRSRVTLDPEGRRIDVEYINGPFRSLVNNWRFEPSDAGGVVVDFFIDFDFRSRALGLVMSAVFHRAVEKLVQAFEDRARALYGTRPMTRLV